MKKVAIIGGGMFGLYCAVELLRNNFKVDVYEQAKYIGHGAFKVNQARLHLGYHYPRCKETTLQCVKGFYKFKKRFPSAINKRFRQYYAIAKKDSKTTAAEYINFCNDLKLPYKVVELESDIINKKLVDLCIEVPEVGFESSEVVNLLEQEIKSLGGRILLNHKVISGNVKSKVKTIEFKIGDNSRKQRKKYDIVVNSAYSNINGLNHAFDMQKIPLAFEMAEMALVSVPKKYNKIGVTIMDGNFSAIMPFGHTGFQTIADVRRTPHERSNNTFPIFKCNKDDQACSAKNINTCFLCSHVPSTNFYKMVNLAQKFIPYARHLQLIKPMFTVKTILNYVENTDARPSKLYTYKEAENYFVFLIGKIDSIIDFVEDFISMLRES